MNKILGILMIAILVASCNDDLAPPNGVIPENHHKKAKLPGMQRKVFNSREELKQVMEAIMNSDEVATRVADQYDIPLSDNEIEYISLLEHNKQKFYETLSPAELAEINSDPEELEFCLPDSVIVDYQFQCLLNKEREIQIGDTVYKYTSKGVGFTSVSNAAQLENLDSLTRNLKPHIGGNDLHILDNKISFIFTTVAQFGDVSFDGYAASGDDDSETPNFSDEKPAAKRDLAIRDGNINKFTIPKEDVREIYYSKNGENDEGTLTFTLKNIKGATYVSAQKFFSKNRKLNMNFYDQNYVIYANIGTKLKMQKKKLGIWWNIKAEEMYHGWDAVSLEYEKQQPVINSFKNESGSTNVPYYIVAETGSPDTSDRLIKVPYNHRTLNPDLVYESFQITFNGTYIGLPSSVKTEIQSLGGSNGYFSFEDKKFEITYGPMQHQSFGKRSMHHKFFSKWFPVNILIGFTLRNGSLQFKNIDLDLDDHVRLVQGCVWGAVKYQGRWLGARIIKMPE